MRMASEEGRPLLVLPLSPFDFGQLSRCLVASPAVFLATGAEVWVSVVLRMEMRL